MAELKTRKLDKSKIAFCTMVLCVASIILLYLYANQLQEFIVKLNELGENKIPNVIWVINHLSVALPVIVLAVILTAFYSKKEAYVPVTSQKEQFYISLFTALFTYGVMLTYVLIKSKNGEVPEGEEIEEVKSLWDITYKWFFVQVIPFVIMISYHAVRADSESKELAENGEQ
ncbi:MAG: hypothetical protein IJY39_05375 [Clostridia bacterium]|nr:hypothetical protein [Clostridia bacterium]